MLAAAQMQIGQDHSVQPPIEERIENKPGLVARIAFADDDRKRSRTFKSGETIDIDVIVKNNLEKTCVLDNREIKVPDSFVIKDSKGNTLKSIIHITQPVLPIDERRFGPNEELGFRVNLLHLYPHVSSTGLGVRSLLTPDKYSLQLIIRSQIRRFDIGDKKWPDLLWPEDIESNVLRFEVTGLSEAEIKKMIARMSRMSEKECIKTIDLFGALRTRKEMNSGFMTYWDR